MGGARDVFGFRREVLIGGFGEWFGLRRRPSEVLTVLFAASGEPMDQRSIVLGVDSHRPMSREALFEAIRTIRAAMETEAIDRDERGYWLTEIGLQDCRDCLLQLAARLQAVGLGEAA